MIKNIFLEHFKNFLDSVMAKTVLKLGTITLNKIPSNIVRDMDRLFNREEIQMALLESDYNISPGPNGLNAACLKHYWKLILPSFQRVLENFFQDGHIPIGINSYFFALIPKISNPTTPTNYRTISLINSIFKVLLKILANRLKLALPHIISEEETGFMQGYNISDGIMITS